MIAHRCDENGINLLNTEEEADVTSIQYINGTNNISMNDDKKCIYKYYAPFLPSKNNEYVSSGSEYYSAKRRVSCHKKFILDLLLNKSNSFEWKVSLLFFINDTKLSSHMAQTSEHINPSNKKNHSYDQMGKMIFNLSNNKWEKITNIQAVSILFRNCYQ